MQKNLKWNLFPPVKNASTPTYPYTSHIWLHAFTCIFQLLTLQKQQQKKKIKRTSGVAEPLPSPPVPLPCRLHGTIFLAEW